MTPSRIRRAATGAIVALMTGLTAACAPGGSGFLGSGFGATADPDSLIGLAPQQIGERLGMPELQRLEPPAEVWQYRTTACVFDLYLYQEEGGRRATHYEARSRSNESIDPALCLGSVVERPRLASTVQVVPTDPAEL